MSIYNKLHVSVTKATDEEFEEMLADLLQPTDPNEILSVSPYKEIHERYPDVPIEYAVKWDEYDKRLKYSPDTIRAMRKVIDALERARDRCNALLQKDFPMSPSYLRSTYNTLAESAYKTKNFLTSLRCFYPWRDDPIRYSGRVYEPSAHSPKLLLNTSDNILLWVPELPTNKQAHSSLAFSELKELLQSNSFADMTQWHCDFIHVFDERIPYLGILDVDNYYYKPVIDAIASALRTTDGHYNFSCSMYNMTSATLIPGCYIHITKREQKVAFFQDFEVFAQPLFDTKKP